MESSSNTDMELYHVSTSKHTANKLPIQDVYYSPRFVYDEMDIYFNPPVHTSASANRPMKRKLAETQHASRELSAGLEHSMKDDTQITSSSVQEGSAFHLDDTYPATSEGFAESRGADGDAYRFRYNRFSPEEGYSPIAGVLPWNSCPQSQTIAHVWCTHEDEDGAICSEPIPGPLSVIVRESDGREQVFQVVDGMCVKNLKEKIWNMTGVLPSSQRLVMANGGDAPDSMPFAGSGMQQYEVLFLKTV